MVFDESAKRRILNMDDASLKELARQIVAASGSSGPKANMLINNPDTLRRMLASLTPDDAEKMLRKADEVQLREINRIVGEINHG